MREVELLGIRATYVGKGQVIRCRSEGEQTSLMSARSSWGLLSLVSCMAQCS